MVSAPELSLLMRCGPHTQARILNLRARSGARSLGLVARLLAAWRGGE
jgi:hypothetical protein